MAFSFGDASKFWRITVTSYTSIGYPAKSRSCLYLLPAVIRIINQANSGGGYGAQASAVLPGRRGPSAFPARRADHSFEPAGSQPADPSARRGIRSGLVCAGPQKNPTDASRAGVSS